MKWRIQLPHDKTVILWFLDECSRKMQAYDQNIYMQTEHAENVSKTERGHQGFYILPSSIKLLETMINYLSVISILVHKNTRRHYISDVYKWYKDDNIIST